jgi:hypothetical protein
MSTVESAMITKEQLQELLRAKPTPPELAHVPRKAIQAQLDAWAKWFDGDEKDPGTLNPDQRMTLAIAVRALIAKADLPTKQKATYLSWFNYKG